MLIEQLNSRLDMKLINRIKKNPKEWEAFRKRGKALYELVKILRSIERSQG